MSGGLVLGAIKIVGGLMAAKTAVEGIKEGNLLKAVVGGVGAYFSFTGLAAGMGEAGAGTAVVKDAVTGGATAGASGAAGTTALTEATASVAADNILAKEAAASLAKEAAITSSNDGIVRGGLLDKVGSAIGDNKFGDWVGSLNDKGGMFGAAADGAEAGGMFSKGGLLGGDYMKGQAISGGMQLAGGYMQGEGMEEQAKWKLEQDRRDYEGQRSRRASIGDMSFMNGLKWNPQAGKFEQAQTA